jgi:c-di-GMP-binding flagellar brake protein YcgR
MANDIAQPGEEPFVVHNTKEILHILNDLSAQKTALKVSFNQGRNDYLTHIIDIDTDNAFVYLDMGIDDAFNKRLLASPEILILKDSGVRIKWKSNQHTMITLLDGNALKIELPPELIRLQRREVFRLAPPITKPVPCEIPIPNAFNPNLKDILQFNLVDVSLGGVGLIVQKGLHPSLVVGASFEDCKINFPETGQTNLKLEVKNILTLPAEKGIAKYRVGLEFVNPSRGNESIIHKYTFNLERAMLVAKNSNK